MECHMGEVVGQWRLQLQWDYDDDRPDRKCSWYISHDDNDDVAWIWRMVMLYPSSVVNLKLLYVDAFLFLVPFDHQAHEE